MRVYLAAFGSGMGHASRMAVVAEAIVSRGGDVALSSSGEIAGWLRAKGFTCNDVPLADVAFNDAGAFSATETLKFSPAILARLCAQVQQEVWNLRRFKPDVVVSDSMITTVLAARMLGIRSVAVVNQLRLHSSPLTPRPIAQFLTGTSVTLVNAFWELCDEVLISDLPPPYTISERNLWNAGSVSSRAKYIGFIFPKGTPEGGSDAALVAWRKEKTRKKVFWQVSGPPATRGILVAKALEVAKSLRDEILFVITAGHPGADPTPIEVPGGFLYRWCNFSGSFLDSCDVVVSRAGHVSISQYIQRAKPCLLVPISAQSEQIGNAEKAQQLGFALCLLEEELDPQSVKKAVLELSGAEFKQRAETAKALAESHDAVSILMQVLETG